MNEKADGEAARWKRTLCLAGSRIVGGFAGISELTNHEIGRSCSYGGSSPHTNL